MMMEQFKRAHGQYYREATVIRHADRFHRWTVELLKQSRHRATRTERRFPLKVDALNCAREWVRQCA